ncbi:MAG TPA: glycosyltransferase, partial [Dehalococcoidia bacterium]|nr:glycosyltransferase [Dehalococcoidia bacterium]
MAADLGRGVTAAPRRVLFVTGEYPPMVGGLADHTACLRGALEDAGWSTAVLTSTDATPSTRVSAIVRRWDWSTCDRLRRAIRAHQPDLVHLQYQTAAYGMHPAICLVPYVLRATGGPPVVVQMHDLRLPYLLPKCAPLRRAVTRALLRWSSGIILTTRSDVDRVDRWLAAASAARLTPAGRPITRLIPIGANLEPNPPPGYDRAAFRGALGLDPETIVIAFFGLANQSKGLPSLIEALAAIHGSGRSAHLL